jgi:hypothetical protein
LIFKVKGQGHQVKLVFFLSTWPTSKSFVRFPPYFVEFKTMMCELCSIKDFIVHWVLPLLCLFGLRNFETIQYALCHCKFSCMINQKFMKLCTLQDPNMKMCTPVGYWIWNPIDFQGQRSRSPDQIFVLRNILVNTRINILQCILTKLGTYLVLRSLEPYWFSRSQGLIFTVQHPCEH